MSQITSAAAPLPSPLLVRGTVRSLATPECPDHRANARARAARDDDSSPPPRSVRVSDEFPPSEKQRRAR